MPRLILERGQWSVDELRAADDVTAPIRGFLVLHGTLTIDMRIAGRTCTRLLSAGDVVLLDGFEQGSIPLTISWSVIEDAGLAILDRRLLAVARYWPRVIDAILARAADQIGYALLQQAICQMPRVENRLLALLWSIADRRGIVRGDGVAVDLPVTQAVLARMIGARRPTVSLGLKTLTDDGLVAPTENGWLLSHRSVTQLTETEFDESTETSGTAP